eukprot:Rmarinus@m.27915
MSSNTTLATVSNDPGTFDSSGGLTEQNVFILLMGILLCGIGFYYVLVVTRFERGKKALANYYSASTCKLVNVVLFILGLGMCGVGTKAGEDGTGEADIGYVALALGLVLCVGAIVGFWGALRDNAGILYIYFAFSLFWSGFIAFTGAYVVMNRDDVERRIKEKCEEEEAKVEGGCEDYFGGKTDEEVIDIINENTVILGALSLVIFALMLSGMVSSGKLLGFKNLVRFFLQTLNGTLALFSVASFAGGIYVSTILEAFTWVAYLVSFIALVVAFAACFGLYALKQNSKKYLRAHFIIMIIFTILLFVFGVIAFAYQTDVEEWVNENRDEFSVFDDMTDSEAETYIKAKLRVAGLTGCMLCVYSLVSVMGTAMLLRLSESNKNNPAAHREVEMYGRPAV